MIEIVEWKALDHIPYFFGYVSPSMKHQGNYTFMKEAICANMMGWA